MDRTTHFYPFGLEFGGDLSTANSITPNYKYSTHGKEKQQETGWSDFGRRMYMSDTGRWFSPDPLSEEFGDWSPYNYVFNNPVRYVDPDGNAPIDVVGEGDGCCGNFFKGVKEGFTGRIDGIKNFASDPYGTTKNVINNYTWSDYGESVANSFTFGIYGTAKTVNKAAQGETRSAGQDVGGVAFDAAVAGVTAGIAKGLKGKVPTIKEPVTNEIYKRPNNATTAKMRAYVNEKGKTEGCATCGKFVDKYVADHKKTLVEEHYQTGTIDKKKMRSTSAVQPQCYGCSAEQAAKMRKYSMEMKKIIIDRTKKEK